MVDERRAESYRRNNKKYYKRHREEILANKPKKYCKYCDKLMYEYYYENKHVLLPKHVKNIERYVRKNKHNNML